ncbi:MULTISPECIES: hypothetical protein [unclassified Imperialibacter]|nr:MULTISPECIES: hypothetical protein [unclassified Imperialibacter]
MMDWSASQINSVTGIFDWPCEYINGNCALVWWIPRIIFVGTSE